LSRCCATLPLWQCFAALTLYIIVEMIHLKGLSTTKVTEKCSTRAGGTPYLLPTSQAAPRPEFSAHRNFPVPWAPARTLSVFGPSRAPHELPPPIGFNRHALQYGSSTDRTLSSLVADIPPNPDHVTYDMLSPKLEQMSCNRMQFNSGLDGGTIPKRP